MNAINDMHGKGFSEVLASFASPTQSLRRKESNATVAQPQGLQGSAELLKKQLAVNDSFWNMLAAVGSSSDSQGGAQVSESGVGGSVVARAALALRLVTAYGPDATEAITGPLNQDRVSSAGQARARRVDSSTSPTQQGARTGNSGFFLAA